MSDEPLNDHSLPEGGLDVRDLTPIGWCFGALAICMIVGGAVAMYQLQPVPRYLGIHIYGTGPAVICAIPLIGVAIGFFKGTQVLCSSLGIPFYRDPGTKRSKTAAEDLFLVTADDYPCTVEQYESRLRRINRLPKLAKATMFIWGTQ